MSEEDELEQSGSLTQQSPKRFDLVETMREHDTRITALHMIIDEVREEMRESLQALMRGQMNRPMIDHSKDAIAGTR